MTNPVVGIVMGSDSDLDIMKRSAKMLRFAGLDFPVFHKVDPHILVGRIERHIVDEAKTMGHTLFLNFI